MHGGLIVKLDGKHYNCYSVEAHADAYRVVLNETVRVAVENWDTFSVVAVYDKNMEDAPFNMRVPEPPPDADAAGEEGPVADADEGPEKEADEPVEE